jgi:hypothetical protein
MQGRGEAQMLRTMGINILAGVIAGLALGIAECVYHAIQEKAVATAIITETSGDAPRPSSE